MSGRWRGRDLSILVGIVVAYVIAGKVGLSLATVNASATPVWLPTGIALAALLVYGQRYWPGIAFGAFVVNVTTTGEIATSLGIALGNTLEALSGAWLVGRFAGGRQAFSRPGGLFRFAALAAISSAVSATVGCATLWLGGLAKVGDAGSIWVTWWLGDAIGALIGCPMLVLWSSGSRLQWTRAKLLEACAVAGGVLLMGSVVFGGFLLPQGRGYPLEFVCLPLILWVAFRFDGRLTATASFGLSVLAIWGTQHDCGPFAHGGRNQSLLLLQVFMGVISITGLAVAAVVAESRHLLGETHRWSETLARSNHELEQFAYIASHDLQEPLRMVTSYLELLQRRYRSLLDENAAGYVQHAVDGAMRMSQLINDLLEFSRVGRMQEVARPTDVAAVVAKVLETLAVPIHESGARIEVAELPTVIAEPFELTQVFQNLIGNALKFRAKDRPLVMGVRAEHHGDEWRFAVSDSGIGIDSAHRGRIFDLFQRLHTRSEYPGTGIGLAICKKIVERNRGRIWVESTLGAGSTFWFSLPLQRSR